MVIKCAAPGCSAQKDGNNEKGVNQFHRFPLKKTDLLAKWLKAMRCPQFKPNSASYLCGAHFVNSDYELKSGNGGKCLKLNAVPSCFEKKRPGRRRKVLNPCAQTVGTMEKVDGSNGGKEKSPKPKEFSLMEASDGVESNLVKLLGGQENDTLQVLIVGEDGKITNSEYILQKQLFAEDEQIVKDERKMEEEKEEEEEQVDEEGEEEEDDRINDGDANDDNDDYDDDDYGNDDDDDHNDNDINKRKEGKERNSSKQSGTKGKRTFSQKRQEGGAASVAKALARSKRKISFLRLKCQKIQRQNRELKLLLRLLILKKGKGDKNLREVLEDCFNFNMYDEAKIKLEH